MASKSTFSSKKRDVILIVCAVLGLTLLVTGICLIICPCFPDNITTHFLNLIGSFLLFIAFIGQIISNRNISKRFNMEKELQRLELLYMHIKEAVDNFTFRSFPENSLCEWREENMGKVQGLAAFDRICRQMTVYSNDISNRLMNEPSVKELKNIFQLIRRFIDQINSSLSDDRNGETKKNIIHYFELVNYLFNSNISVAECLQEIQAEAPIQKDGGSGKIEEHSAYCIVCGYIHGIPEGIKKEVKGIKGEMAEIRGILNYNDTNEDTEKND